jgi:DGQHR domain-containing protein
MFTTKAVRFIQNGRIFYVTAIPAKELIHLTKVDVWKEGNPDDQKGYQRAPSSQRKREIAEYVEGKDAIMPIGGLANSRASSDDQSNYGSNLKFKAEWENGDVASGELSIPKNALPLYIVDMQHRLGGFQHAIEEDNAAELEDYPLPITIADGLSLLEEVDQFDLINTTQKKVRTDLARRLKVIQSSDTDHRNRLDESGKLWEARGAKIADILNKSDGVWKGRIMAPNASKKESPRAIIKETSFVTSLKPILQTPFFVRQQEEHAAELIRRYWEAIARIFPKAVKNAEEHVILKTPGIFSLHSIAPFVFELVRDRGGDLTVNAIEQVLSNLGNQFDDDFWFGDSEDGASLYGSMKGFKILSTKLRNALPAFEPKL